MGREMEKTQLLQSICPNENTEWALSYRLSRFFTTDRFPRLPLRDGDKQAETRRSGYSLFHFPLPLISFHRSITVTVCMCFSSSILLSNLSSSPTFLHFSLPPTLCFPSSHLLVLHSLTPSFSLAASFPPTSFFYHRFLFLSGFACIEDSLETSLLIHATSNPPGCNSPTSLPSSVSSPASTFSCTLLSFFLGSFLFRGRGEISCKFLRHLRKLSVLFWRSGILFTMWHFSLQINQMFHKWIFLDPSSSMLKYYAVGRKCFMPQWFHARLTLIHRSWENRILNNMCGKLQITSCVELPHELGAYDSVTRVWVRFAERAKSEYCKPQKDWFALLDFAVVCIPLSMPATTPLIWCAMSSLFLQK